MDQTHLYLAKNGQFAAIFKVAIQGFFFELAAMAFALMRYNNILKIASFPFTTYQKIISFIGRYLLLSWKLWKHQLLADNVPRVSIATGGLLQNSPINVCGGFHISQQLKWFFHWKSF